VVLLPGREDRDIWSYFASLAFPAERIVREVLAALDSAGQALSTQRLEPMVDLARGRLEMVLKVLDVDGAVRRVRGGCESTGQPWEYDAERYERIATARDSEQRAIEAYQETDGCRMEFLLRQLDDPHASPCGRCDNCTGERWSDEVSGAGVEAARERLRRPGVDLPPKKQWPTGMSTLGVQLSGKVKPGQVSETGRALGRLTDIGWGNRLREVFAAPDAPIPDDVFDACVKVLAAWDWEKRPAGVVTIASGSRPQLVSSFGSRIASIGRLPLLGEVWTGERAPRANSAHRLAQLWGSVRVSDELAARVSEVEGPVLVIDDRVDTGWTMTVAAAMLRDAGAEGVMPFALATTS
jgi:ATP-dependent DNA helicase RecQ